MTDPDSNEARRKIHAAVREVLKHHGLTKHGGSVVEADLIHAVLSNRDAADEIEWLEKGNAEWRSLALNNAKLLATARAQANIAVAHLHKMLNSRRTATQALEDERAAREWLESIGSEAP